MPKRILMIAFHFPPMQGSSGLQRTLKFVRYLPDFGWEPMVMSIQPEAYYRTSQDQMDDIPEGLVWKQAPGFNASKRFSVAGLSPRFLNQPDPWWSWRFGAVKTALKMIAEHQPDVIWTTHPIATAHWIGARLKQITGLPWVADFRDAMVEPGWPADWLTYKTNEWVERRTVGRMDRGVLVSPAALDLYKARYPEVPEDHWGLILNGFDEADFAAIEPEAKDGPVTLLHSGVLYPEERDPRAFFKAVKTLKTDHGLSGDRLHIVLRATGSDDYYKPLLDQFEIADVVQLAPSVPYRDALKEMCEVDGLLLFQAKSCNSAIPAKLYEYMRAAKPLLALTHPDGDTARIMGEAGAGEVLDLDKAEDITQGLLRFLDQIKQASAPIAAPDVVARYSRRSASGQLAELLDNLTRR